MFAFKKKLKLILFSVIKIYSNSSNSSFKGIRYSLFTTFCHMIIITRAIDDSQSISRYLSLWYLQIHLRTKSRLNATFNSAGYKLYRIKIDMFVLLDYSLNIST